MSRYELLGVNLSDTLNASGLAAGATSATLTTGNFGSPSGVQLLIVDYDVPAKIEVISATIAGTGLSGITRALSGTSDVAHSANANIMHSLTPTHWDDRVAGVSQQNNTTNTVITKTRVQTGWGWWVGDATNLLFTDSITFPTAFTARPVVTISILGGKASATPSDIGDFVDYNAVLQTAGVFITPFTTAISTTGFSASMRMNETAANFTTSESVGYAWTAIGPV